MPAEDSDRKNNVIRDIMRLPDYSAGGLLADQAVLPLNIHRGSTSAGMSHADAATEAQGDCRTDSVIVEFHPAG